MTSLLFLHFFYSLEHTLDLEVYPTHVYFTELTSLGSEMIQLNKFRARIPGFWGQCHTDVTGTWLEVLIAKLVKPLSRTEKMSLVTFYPAGQIVHMNIFVCLCLIKKRKIPK